MGLRVVGPKQANCPLQLKILILAKYDFSNKIITIIEKMKIFSQKFNLRPFANVEIQNPVKILYEISYQQLPGV